MAQQRWICDSLFTEYEPVSNYRGTSSMHVFIPPAKKDITEPLLFVCVCVLESQPQRQNFLIPGTAPRQLKMENCSLFSPTHASHSTFVSNTQHLYLSGSRAGSTHHRCLSKYSTECFKGRGTRPGGGTEEGPWVGWGPLKGVRWCFLRQTRQRVCPLSHPVRGPRDSNTSTKTDVHFYS